MLSVFIARLLHLLIVAEVIVTVRQSQSTLYRLGDNRGRVFVILGRAKAENGGNLMLKKTRKLVFQTKEVRHFIHTLQLTLQRPDAFGVQLLLVPSPPTKNPKLLVLYSRHRSLPTP